jgi:hypothetical protein
MLRAERVNRKVAWMKSARSSAGLPACGGGALVSLPIC